MKRVLAAVAAVILALSGCGGEKEDERITTPDAGAETVWESAHDPIEDAISRWTLDEKLWQLFYVTPEDLTGGGDVTAFSDSLGDGLGEYPVGGVILFAKNIVNKSQVSRLLGDIKAASATAPFLGVDEEGGIVTRLSKSCGVTDNGNMRDVKTADAARAVGERLGSELGALGFNMDFAPVADVLINPDNTEIGPRSFGTDAADAAEKVAALVEGLEGRGLSSVLKHFPGHGSTSVNSHKGTSVSGRTLDQLRAEELLPFKSGIEAGADFVMVSHMSLPEVVGDDTPCSLSKTVITGLLREELGYDGIVITDALNMGAVTDVYGPDEACVKAIEAGADMLLMPTDPRTADAALKKAVDSGRITEERIDESLRRILSVKAGIGLIS